MGEPPIPEKPASGRYGPYEVIQEIGRGGMGSVYRARHVETGTEHALKVVRPKDDPEKVRRAFRRLEREAETLEAIEPHPGIVRLHSFGMEGTHPWYSMDLIRGKPLSALLRDGPLEPERAARIVSAVARAIEHVHTHGVVHRDIKPGNILIDRDDRPHMCDFGLAFDAMAVEGPIQIGAAVGTLAYMAPEQVVDPAETEEDELRPAVDVYGLGAVLYIALTGAPPFGELEGEELVEAIIDREPERPRRRNPAVPRALDAICRRALAKRPEERFASSEELADELDRFVAGEPIHTRVRPSRRLRSERPARAPGAFPIGWALLVIIALAGIVVFGLVRALGS